MCSPPHSLFHPSRISATTIERIQSLTSSTRPGWWSRLEFLSVLQPHSSQPCPGWTTRLAAKPNFRVSIKICDVNRNVLKANRHELWNGFAAISIHHNLILHRSEDAKGNCRSDRDGGERKLQMYARHSMPAWYTVLRNHNHSSNRETADEAQIIASAKLPD